ncbi:hypothetical protein [Amycolatopsis thermoflava]|uniref:hypothetical protein n=1 Tax=Amycolatopsis thermoflava TaxID=84480 RepID=UPI0037FE3DA0
MTPGTDADVRRRRRTRNRFLGACLVVAAVTGTVVTGAFTDGLSGGVAGAVPAIALFLCAAAVLAAQALHWHRFAVTRVRELAATEQPAVAGRDRQSRDARELLEHGTRVSATVVTAPDPRKGNATIEVTYPAGDTRRAAMIKLSTRQR